MTKPHPHILLLLLSLIVLTPTQAAERRIPLTEKVHTDEPFALNLIGALRGTIPHIMKASGTPGLNLAIGYKGELIWEAGFGYADIAAKKKMTPSTVYHSGSLGKTYTGTAIMQLVEQEVIDLDTDISEYLPFDATNPLGDRVVTVRDLMTHRSGMQTDPAGSDYDKPLALDAALKTIFEKAEVQSWGKELWRTKVGETWHYSNPGIATLGLIVESMNPEGLSFADYVQQHIMDPLGMRAAQYPPAQHKDYVRPDIWKQMSTGYTRMGSAWIPTIPVYFGLYPAGGVLQTPSDHLRLLMAMLNDGKHNGYQVLKAETVEQMLSPELAVKGEALVIGRPGAPRQGLIWRINKQHEKIESFDHAGGHMFGWRTDGRAWSNFDLAIAMGTNQWSLPNSANENLIIREFVDAWLAHQSPDVSLRPATKNWAWKVSYVRGLIFAKSYQNLGAGDALPAQALNQSIARTKVQPGWRKDWDAEAFRQGINDITQAGFETADLQTFWESGASQVDPEEVRVVMKELGVINALEYEWLVPRVDTN